MALIKLSAQAGEKYRSYLATYRRVTGQEPGPAERTEAFFCSRSANAWDRPAWVR